MASLVAFFLTGLAAFLTIPVVIFVIEISAALLLSRRGLAGPPKEYVRKRIAVIVPAHNESVGILPTLADIKQQLLANDRLVVVADNCVDDTSAIAAHAGAETIVRHEPEAAGKGYALDFGLKHLSLDPPAIVIVIDADCRITKDTIAQLSLTCAMTGRPVQALDLMTAPEGLTINYRVAEFAWRIKNWVRPLGLSVLNFPCQLMGTGMAFPWEIIFSANLANGSIVEDLKLGLDLAKEGAPALFCPTACVTSPFPQSIKGARSQRKRWEEGHIGLILKTVPQFVREAIASRNLGLFVLALDLAIPPLSLLVILLTVMTGLAGITAMLGISFSPLAISVGSAAALALAIFLSWLKYGRDILPPLAIFSVISYVFAKLPIYGCLLSGRFDLHWIRTDRKKNK